MPHNACSTFTMKSHSGEFEPSCGQKLNVCNLVWSFHCKLACDASSLDLQFHLTMVVLCQFVNNYCDY